MASFAKSYGNTIGTTSCCDAHCKVSGDKSTLVCMVCDNEVIVVPVGVTHEQALIDHARETTQKAKRTTVSPVRHNAIQIMQHFGESTFLLANDQWELWNIKDKTEEDVGYLDKLVIGIMKDYL